MKICSNKIIELQEIVTDYNNFVGDDENSQKIIIDLGKRVGEIEVYQYNENIGYSTLDSIEELEKLIKEVKYATLDDERYNQHLLNEEYATKVTDFEIAIERGKY